MANPEHLKILKSGVEEWNKWRETNEEIQANLSNIDLSNANLSNIDLSNTNLRNANLSYTYFSNSNFSNSCLRDVKLHNAYLNDAKLRNVDLDNAKLSYVDLRNADLQNAILRNVNLHNANLRNADLRNADLRNADLHNANLRYANFRNANFRYANLRDANLENSNFNKAIFYRTIFESNDLTSCIHLEAAKHYGPSLIEGRTIKFNYNNLPIKFLKGCGLNNWEIEALKLYNPNITEIQITDTVYKIDQLRNISPIQPYSIFISYSRKDEPFIKKLEETFDTKDICYWRDVHHATAGPLEKQITNAIHLNPTVLLVLSKESVQSDWVEFESRKARELEKKLNRHVICPVALDDSWKTCSWPERLRQQIEEYHILDFSQWQNEVFFDRQFSKLLTGLNIYYKNRTP